MILRRNGAAVIQIQSINQSIIIYKLKLCINQFLTNVPILYPLKITFFLGIFRVYKMKTFVRNGWNRFFISLHQAQYGRLNMVAFHDIRFSIIVFTLLYVPYFSVKRCYFNKTLNRSNQVVRSRVSWSEIGYPF